MQNATELKKASLKGHQNWMREKAVNLSTNEKDQLAAAMLWFDEELPALIEYATSRGFTHVDYLGVEDDNRGEHDHLVSDTVANKIAKAWHKQLNPRGGLFSRKIRVRAYGLNANYRVRSIRISWGKYFWE